MPLPTRIVDTHHHLWDLTENFYPWLRHGGSHPMFGDDYEILRRDYLAQDLLVDIDGLPVLRSVHLQADHDPADPVRETAWLDNVAQQPGIQGFPHAIVGYADFFSDQAEAVLEAHARYPRVRGIRQTLHHRKGEPLRNETWLKNFNLLARHVFHFELQVYPHQRQEGLALVDNNPDMLFVLPHCGLPEDRSPAGVQAWRDAMKEFARRNNTVCKLSGFGMLKRDWQIEDIRPIILDVVDIFGAGRVMFGSNFPVDRFAGSYRRAWESFFDVTAAFAADEIDQMYWGTAIRVYRLDEAN